MKTVTSGIPGMDEIFDDGFRTPYTVLIKATAGKGKTTFVMHSAFNAALNDEVCIYVTTTNKWGNSKSRKRRLILNS